MFLTGLEDGIFPHMRSLGDPEALEEERRLCYVGITRARERLYLCHAWCRQLFGATDYYPPSRFLAEIPEELVQAQGEPHVAAAGRARGFGSHRDAVVAAAVASGRGAVPAAVAAAAPGSRGAEQLGLHVGDDVTHEKFGEGVILDVIGDGDKAEAVVRFRDAARSASSSPGRRSSASTRRSPPPGAPTARIRGVATTEVRGLDLDASSSWRRSTAIPRPDAAVSRARRGRVSPSPSPECPTRTSSHPTHPSVCAESVVEQPQTHRRRDSFARTGGQVSLTTEYQTRWATRTRLSPIREYRR